MIGPRPAGLGRYARELVARLPRTRPDLEFVVIKRPAMAREALVDASNAVEVIVPAELDHPANLVSAAAIARLRLDLYHSLHHFLPLGISGPRVVVTLHDLIWVEHAKLAATGRLHSLVMRAYGTATMWHALRRADRVISISEATRRQAILRFGVSPERISVVWHGIDHFGTAASLPTPCASAGRRGRRYLVALGNTKPYKNMPTVLRALARVRIPDLELVIVGRGDHLPELRRLAHTLGIERQVSYSGVLADADVQDLLAGACALVFPSRVEGFGLPLLEAMAVGCPVISSDIPVVREVVGDAALLVPPLSADALARAIERVSQNIALAERLRDLGRTRASAFRWERAVRQTADVYDQLL